MLTKKQNLIETMTGGHPDRFVNQYEAFAITFGSPIGAGPQPKRGDYDVKDNWGIYRSWPENVPGAFPVHTPDKVVIKDITHWRDYVHMHKTDFLDSAWEPFIARAEAVDRNEQFVLPFVAPGVFDMTHFLCEIQNALINFYEEPEAMHELIDYLTEYELILAEKLCHYVKPDGIFHHDDWGTQISTFLSPEMFEEFFLPSYKQIYGYYKSHGAELIVHHSDSYAATLVPYMIDMGISIWQGVMNTNNVPELIKKYGGKITFMGGIDSASVDRPDWNQEMVAKEVRRACTECGKLYFIPNTTQGLPMSTYPGVYQAVTEEIDKMSKEMF